MPWFKKYLPMFISLSILTLICAFWLLHQPWKTNMALNSNHINNLGIEFASISLEDVNQAKQLFAADKQQDQNLSSISLVGIIHNSSNHQSKYIILNAQNTNTIYRLNNFIPQLGRLTAIYPNYIEVETIQGYTQQIKLSKKQNENTNADTNLNANISANDQQDIYGAPINNTSDLNSAPLTMTPPPTATDAPELYNQSNMQMQATTAVYPKGSQDLQALQQNNQSNNNSNEASSEKNQSQASPPTQ